jgi:type II secretion system protein N
MEKTKKGSSRYIKLGYVAIFIVVFLISVYRLFPYDKAKDYLEVRLSQATGADVTISKLDFSLFSGVKFSGVSVTKDIAGTQTDIINVDQVTVGSYYTLLMPGEKSLSIDTKLYGGSVSGWLHFGGKDKTGDKVDIRLKDIDISKNTVLKSLYNVNTGGKLTGSILLRDMKKGLMDFYGEIHLSLNDGAVKGIMLDKIGSGMLRFDNMTLPDISFNTLNLDVVKKQKNVMLEKAKVSGDELNLNAAGNITLNRNIKASATSLNVGFNLTDNYLKKDKTLSLFNESFKSMKGANGFYNIKIEGPIANPRIKTM